MNSAEYQRRYRTKNPERHAESSLRSRLRNKAAAKVAARYPDEWQRAYRQECRARGIEPHPPTGRPPRVR